MGFAGAPIVPRDESRGYVGTATPWLRGSAMWCVVFHENCATIGW